MTIEVTGMLVMPNAETTQYNVNGKWQSAPDPNMTNQKPDFTMKAEKTHVLVTMRGSYVKINTYPPGPTNLQPNLPRDEEGAWECYLYEQ